MARRELGRERRGGVRRRVVPRVLKIVRDGALGVRFFICRTFKASFRNPLAFVQRGARTLTSQLCTHALKHSFGNPASHGIGGICARGSGGTHEGEDGGGTKHCEIWWYARRDVRDGCGTIARCVQHIPGEGDRSDLEQQNQCLIIDIIYYLNIFLDPTNVPPLRIINDDIHENNR